MSARNRRILQHSRILRMVQLGQQGIEIDNSKKQNNPAETFNIITESNQNKEQHLVSTQNAIPKTINNENALVNVQYAENIDLGSTIIKVTDAELLNFIESIEESSKEESTQNQTNVGIRKGVLENIEPNIITEVQKTYLHQSCEDPSTSDITRKEDTGLADFFQTFTAEDNLGTEVQHENVHNIVLTKSIQTSSNSQMMLHDTTTEKETSLVSIECENSNHSMSILNNTQEPENFSTFDDGANVINEALEISDDPEWIPRPTSNDSDVTDAESIISDNQNIQNVRESINIGQVKKTRKRIADPSEWNDNKNKKKREYGEAYQGWTKRKGNAGKRGAEREERKLGPSCILDSCRKTRDCHKVTQEEREHIFNFFWKKMSWDQKKVYVSSLVLKSTPKQRTTEGATSRRQTSFAYRLKSVNGNNVLKVCKGMFLSTLGLNEWMVMNWVKGSDAGMAESTEERNDVRRLTRPPMANASKDYLVQFLDKLPKLPSHYCRKSTSKVYLEPTSNNSMSDLYKEYKKECVTSDPPQKPLSSITFHLVLKEKNIGFQPPKKDRCDLCISHEVGNAEEEVYQNHIIAKERAREEKAFDKSEAEKGNCVVLTMDLQAVKICPSLNASALYYKTKLCVHNFTIFNINTKNCRCYWFDETEADLTANTFASCLIDYLNDTLINSQTPVLIIWSDGCTYQNRNATLSNALLSFSVDKNVIIYQKYLTKGHTQMEVDSVHATIERKIKNKPIYLPSDYIRLTSEARRRPEPYEIKSLDFTFCRNYGVDPVYSSIRPGKYAGDPQVTDIKIIKYTPDGVISVKTSFSNEFLDIPKKRGNRSVVQSLDAFPQLHKQRLPIKKQKWLHLQELKTVILRDCHAFYDNLPHH